ncbi:T-complex protein 1 subunit theta [Savitreella phatthalungensis]
MSLKVPKPPGTQLFKDGYRSSQGVEDAVQRNISAIHELTEILRTSFGPNGRNKIIVNHLSKVILTADAATIMRELEIIHPAAKLLVMASQQQEAEMGDATNLVIILAGEMLQQAGELLTLGLHPAEIIQGYEIASKHALECIEELSVDDVGDIKAQDELAKAIRTAIGSKQYGNEAFLGELVSEAILTVLPRDPKNFNVDSIRVVKILGSSLSESRVVRGMVFPREAEGTVKKVAKAKVAVFSCPLDISQTETKGTVLLHNAKEMLDFTKGEEAQLEAIVKEIYEAGVRVAITGSAVGDLMLHYLNRYGIFVIKVLSKFDVRRLCRVVGATPLARVGAPMPEEMGFVDVVETVEIGGDRVTVFRQEDEQTKTSTIVLRGATQNHLDDVERAIDDGVNVVKALVKDSRLVPGAGAVELELLKRIEGLGDKTPGLLQHGIKRYAHAFEIVPRTLLENAGLDVTETLAKLRAAHHKNDLGLTGIDIDDESDGTFDSKKHGVLDALAAKQSAIKLATEACLTVLSVDQIIMSKVAGGPKVPQQQGGWDNDD